VNGTSYCTHAAAAAMFAHRYGSIVSVLGSYAWQGDPGTGASAAAKAGVLTMTRTLAAEWAPHGVRLNCIAPGPTETEGAGAALWPGDAARERVLDTVPQGRMADPDEVADTASFLLEDRSAYIPGEVLTADGGQSLGKQVYGEPVAPPARHGCPRHSPRNISRRGPSSRNTR